MEQLYRRDDAFPRITSSLTLAATLCAEDFAPAVRRGLSAFHAELPSLLGQMSGPTREVVHFAHHKVLNERIGAFLPAFQERLCDAVLQLRSAASEQDAQAERCGSSTQWTLETVDLGGAVAVSRAVAVGAECKHGLYLLGLRFGVLAGMPAFPSQALPISPVALEAHLLDTSREVFGEDFPHHLLADRLAAELFTHYRITLDRLNEALDSAGLLPGLTHVPARRRAASAPRVRPAAPTQATESRAIANAGNAASAAAASASQAEITDGERIHGAATGDGGVAAVSLSANSTRATPTQSEPQASSAQSPDPATPNAQSQAAMPPPMPGGWFAQPPAASAADAHASSQANAESSPFARAQALLRRAHGGAPISAVPASPLPPGFLEAMLDALPPVTAPAGGKPRSIRHLHDDLRSRIKTTLGPDARLPRHQNDALELLGMLYDAVSRDVRVDSDAMQLLGRLQVPLVRMALSSPAFFEQPEHPGRRIVDTVAETGATHHDDADPKFEGAVRHAVDRVEREYRGEDSVLHTINGELQGALDEHAQRSEAAERHQIEAARGRERLTLAQEEVRALLDERLAALRLHRHVDMLIRTAWHDALVFVRLRNGDDSDLWRRQMRLTQRMLDVVSSPDPVHDVDLRDSVAAAVRKTGYHAEEAEAIAATLSRSESAPRIDTQMPMTELAMLVKARPRFGQSTKAETEIAQMPQPRSREEEECFQRLRLLPYGTWLEFQVNQQGAVLRRRLSWYSTVTGNALLVNRRGARVAEMQLDAMARLMASGQLRVVKQDDMRLIDRAWRATMAALEGFAQFVGAGKPAAHALS